MKARSIILPAFISIKYKLVHRSQSPSPCCECCSSCKPISSDFPPLAARSHPHSLSSVLPAEETYLPPARQYPQDSCSACRL